MSQPLRCCLRCQAKARVQRGRLGPVSRRGRSSSSALVNNMDVKTCAATCPRWGSQALRSKVHLGRASWRRFGQRRGGHHTGGQPLVSRPSLFTVTLQPPSGGCSTVCGQHAGACRVACSGSDSSQHPLGHRPTLTSARATCPSHPGAQSDGDASILVPVAPAFKDERPTGDPRFASPRRHDGMVPVRKAVPTKQL